MWQNHSVPISSIKDLACPYSQGSGWLVVLSDWLSSSWTRQWNHAGAAPGVAALPAIGSQPCWANSLRHPRLTEPPLLRWYFLRWSHLFPSLAQRHSDSSILSGLCSHTSSKWCVPPPQRAVSCSDLWYCQWQTSIRLALPAAPKAFKPERRALMLSAVCPRWFQIGGAD